MGWREPNEIVLEAVKRDIVYNMLSRQVPELFATSQSKMRSFKFELQLKSMSDPNPAIVVLENEDYSTGYKRNDLIRFI